MSMYILLEYSNNYFMISGRLLNYSKDEVNDSAIEFNNDSNKINSSKTITSKSFECKTEIIGSTPND